MWRRVQLLLPALIYSGAALGLDVEPTRLRPHEGANPPGFYLDQLGGGRQSLADRSGRVVLVHFFATWCQPCRPEMASLNRLAARLEPVGLSVVALSVAEVELRLTRFFGENPVRFPILMDRDRAVARNWGIVALPSTVVLDRAGRARLAVRGDVDWERPEIVAALEDLLKDEGSASPDSPDNANREMKR